MATSPAILNKIKLLLKLGTSPNPHEADSARKLAEGLIEKHSVSQEELESLKDPKPLYGDDEKLFETLGLVGWRQQLALAVGTHFECQIVQEEYVPTEGPHIYHYFVYGDSEDVNKVQLSYHAFAKEVEKLVDIQCLGHGPVYTFSYCEGVVDAIKQNILLHGIDIPEVRRPLKKDAVVTKQEGLVKQQDARPKAAEERVNVNTQSIVQDIMAYFKGIQDGKELFLDEIMAIASQSQPVKELKKDEYPAPNS